MLRSTHPLAQSRASRRQAFTLIEVLVVMAILVILAGVASVALFRNIEDAKKNKAQLQCKAIATAVHAYMSNPANPYNQFPQGGLAELAQPSMGTSFLPNGQQDLVDPWQGQYQWKVIQGADGSEDYLIYTIAKDGTPISQYGIGPGLWRGNQ
jgi:general secretion pathway protein G